MAFRISCRRCGEPRSTSYIGPSCPVCRYENETGHRLERIPDRPMLEDAELVRLLELPSAGPTLRGLAS